ncbi:ABC transporter ATP-binding protein [Amycolatopsis sp. DSM 110486]|uniref:ABC transporter ATP-binding protein n=1 Tax=Amycolatopsis sp. DSM 110486 TaxID=2865832 RepID=UPI001C69AC5E|nr:ATP-binding cassette domain-containing protein [Amycolatopsis sp. DSM 110486]QYN26370.1 ATP-binding cassette domain-containing protein [Amycolatopsis sp. DSM 110486]
MSSPDSEVPALRVADLCVHYGSLRALSDVSWTVSDGEILGIIGPNGAGKSSSFAAVTNTVRRTGTVELYGSNVDSVPTHRLSRRGLRRTFQQNSFYSGLSVLDNAAATFAVENGVPLAGSVFTPWREAKQRSRTRKAAADLLTDFGIPARYHGMFPDNIPYGLQRCLSIVFAYGAGARVLLVDEPAAGVGGEDMHNLAELLLQLRDRGLAVVLIEHHMDLVMEIVDRLLVIDRGEPIAYGEPEAVQRDPAVLEAYLGRPA